MKVLKKTQNFKFLTRKTQQVKRIWPKGYKRFDTGEDKERFEVRPQKYNLRLIFLSLVIFLVLWVFIIQPYLDKHPKKEEPIRVKIFKEDAIVNVSPKAK